MPINNADLINRFEYHPPDSTRALAHEALRTLHFQLAARVLALTPEGREQSLAITKLEEAMMWANAAIARQES